MSYDNNEIGFMDFHIFLSDWRKTSVYILIYLMRLLEPEGILRMDPVKIECLKLNEMPEEDAITELIGLYRSFINNNLDKLHLRCDRLNHGLKYIVLTVILSFVAYALKILLRIA